MIEFKNKKTLIFTALLIGLVLTTGVMAQDTEVDYPMEGPTTTRVSLGEYVSYIYRFALILGGLIAFGAFVYGGFTYLTSAGNAEAVNSAQSYMVGGVTGLLLLLASYLIIITINPDIISTPEEMKPSHGVCFYKQQNAEGQKACYSQSSKTVLENFTVKSIEFESPQSELEGMYTFPQEGWEGTEGYLENEREDYDSDPDVQNIIWTPKSFFLEWNKPGIYLYKGKNQKLGFPNQPYRVYQDQVSNLDDYSDQVQSLKFESKGCEEDEEGNYYPEIGYAAVLHSQTNYKGECSVAIGSEPTTIGLPGTEDYCTFRKIDDLTMDETNRYLHPIGTSTSSITPFNYAFTENEEGQITFYEQEDYQGDHFSIETGTIGELWSTTTLSYPISTSTSNFEVKEGDGATDNAELSKILSYKVEGNFMVVITQGEDLEFNCQASDTSNPQLKDDYVSSVNPNNPGDSRITSIIIIPLRSSL